MHRVYSPTISGFNKQSIFQPIGLSDSLVCSRKLFLIPTLFLISISHFILGFTFEYIVFFSVLQDTGRNEFKMIAHNNFLVIFSK
jgi:hypothetical protein